MAKRTYPVGVGFPNRLQALLSRHGLRAADLERAGVVNADTCNNWLSGRCHPERTTYLKFVKHLSLTAEAARKLLLASPEEPLLVPPTAAQRELKRTLETLERVGDLAAALSQDEVRLLHEQLLAGSRATREVLRQWMKRTTTLNETAS